MAEIHNYFSKLLPRFRNNHIQIFRDYVPNINALNKVLYDLPAKALRSKPVKFEITTGLSLELNGKRNSVLHALLIQIRIQNLFSMACFVENGNTSFR